MGISRKFQRKKQRKDYIVAKKAIKDGSAWIDDDGGVHFIEHDEEAENDGNDNLKMTTCANPKLTTLSFG